MWFKFDSASGRLATSNPIESISHQVTKPLDAQNFKPTEMVFDRPVKLVRSAVGLRQNATAAAVPNKPAPGTILPNGYVMGEFGAYDPKIRKLQDFFSKDDGTLVWLKKGASDRAMMAVVTVLAAGVAGCIALNAVYLIFPSFAKKK